MKDDNDVQRKEDVGRDKGAIGRVCASKYNIKQF
jgi:hypothetical protein